MGLFSRWFGGKRETVFIPKENVVAFLPQDDVVVEPEFVVDIKKFRPVPKWTHAGHAGRDLFCPQCGKSSRVYHFSWSALTCSHCSAAVDKYDWLLEIKQIRRRSRDAGSTNPRLKKNSQFLRINDILDRLSISRETLRRWRRTGVFPNPKHLGPGDFRVVWDPSEIEDWIKTRPAGRFRQ